VIDNECDNINKRCLFHTSCSLYNKPTATLMSNFNCVPYYSGGLWRRDDVADIRCSRARRSTTGQMRLTRALNLYSTTVSGMLVIHEGLSKFTYEPILYNVQAVLKGCIQPGT